MRDDLPRIDEAARPTWNAPPAVKESLEGMGGQLVQVHRHLREELRRLLRVVDDVVAEKQNAETAKPLAEGLSRSMSYVSLGNLCSGYCSMLTMHHSIEDRSVFPELQRIEPSLKPVLAQLQAEHGVIARIIDRLSSLLDAAARSPAALAQVKSAAETLGRQLSSHLDYEEAELVPALNAYGSRL
jgi:iron-sulfur cluster repair protein YtfE (RIC family)